jgi:HAD superfamily hydrolase (TIGR01484 family)
MRPFATLSDATLATVAGVASDLDDTLTTHGLLSRTALEALHALAAAQVPCIVVTGRPLGWGEVIARLLPVQAVVTENGGAWIVREGDRLRVAFLQDEATRVAGMARVQTMVDHLVQTYPALQRVQDLTVRATDVALDLHESTEVSESLVAEAMERVREAGLYAVASTVHLHVSASPPDKVAGLRAALADAGLDPEPLVSRWLYVGDSPNDASAFSALDLSVGVANVRAFEGRMSAWPKYVTEGSTGEGFAEVTTRLLRVRAGGVR